MELVPTLLQLTVLVLSSLAWFFALSVIPMSLSSAGGECFFPDRGHHHLILRLDKMDITIEDRAQKPDVHSSYYSNLTRLDLRQRQLIQNLSMT